ncbi:MAG TPA: hypothetical protein VNO30_12830 [Kofleriaceae bacterium]|nr:hypothetical protein [Kofleriaceae bacterium]
MKSGITQTCLPPLLPPLPLLPPAQISARAALSRALGPLPTTLGEFKLEVSPSATLGEFKLERAAAGYV